jgi:hypothetical protein
MIITIAVEEIAFGKIYRLLDTMPGVVSISYHAEGPKDKAASKPNGKIGKPRNSYEVTGNDFMLGFMYKNDGPYPTARLREAFSKAGRSPASVASLLHKAKANGSVENRDDGYVLTKKVRDRLRHKQENK